MCVYMYTYIYIYREREMFLYMYIHTYTHLYVITWRPSAASRAATPPPRPSQLLAR